MLKSLTKVAAVLLIFVLISGFYCFSFAEDKIVAIVNKDVITQKDLNDFINFTRMQLSQQYKGAALEKKIESMKKDLMDRLIEDRLILQEAKKTGIKADESRVKARVSEVKANYPSEAQFQSDLVNQGLTQADIESKIRDQILMYAVIQIKVRQKIVVRPEEVTAFYNQNPETFKAPEEREVTIVALENQDLAKTFSYNLKIGQKIDDLATRYPITLDKLRAVQGEDLRKDIEGVIFKLGLGEISEPEKIDEKYYIFILDNIIPAHQLNLAQAQDKIQNFLLDKKTEEEMLKWLDELKKQSYIQVF